LKEKPVELTRANMRCWNFLRAIAAKSSRARSFTSICSTKRKFAFHLLDVHVSNVRKKLGAESSPRGAARLLHRMKIFTPSNGELQIWYGLILVVVLAGFGLRRIN